MNEKKEEERVVGLSRVSHAFSLLELLASYLTICSKSKVCKLLQVLLSDLSLQVVSHVGKQLCLILCIIQLCALCA